MAMSALEKYSMRLAATSFVYALPTPNPVGYWYQTWTGWQFCNAARWSIDGKRVPRGTPVIYLFTAGQLQEFAITIIEEWEAKKVQSMEDKHG